MTAKNKRTESLVPFGAPLIISAHSEGRSSGNVHTPADNGISGSLLLVVELPFYRPTVSDSVKL